MSLTESEIVDKPWGHEVIFAKTKDYVGKVLVVKAGEQLSLQYHQIKEESFYVARGKIELTLEDESGELRQHILSSGMSAHVPPNTKHRMKGIEDSEVFEVSTPHLEDVVRIKDQYGRQD